MFTYPFELTRQNIARRFSYNSIVSALITGLDVNIINTFRIILQVTSSGYAVGVKKCQIRNRNDNSL